MSERYSQDKFRALEQAWMRKPEVMAASINEQFAGALPDEMQLRDVFEFVADTENPFIKWHRNAGDPRRIFVQAVGACIRGGFETVGEVRLADGDELMERSRTGHKAKHRTMTPDRAAFIKRAFEPQKPQE